MRWWMTCCLFAEEEALIDSLAPIVVELVAFES